MLNDLQEIAPLILDGRVRKAVVTARRVRHANHRYPITGSSNQECHSFLVFDGDGIAQKDQIEISVPELDDRLSDGPGGGDVASSRLPN
jgi:hypothetical protein